MGMIVVMLPWWAVILINLLGFGVLSWRPKRKKEIKKVRVYFKSAKPKVKVEKKSDPSRKKLRKSRDKKIAGVAAGIADYFNIDPTLVRIAFVVGTIASGGPFFFAYLVLAMLMPKPDAPAKKEERITIIRDS
jgi:phage shock protein C